MFKRTHVAVRIAGMTPELMEKDEAEISLVKLSCEVNPLTPELAQELHDFVRSTLFTMSGGRGQRAAERGEVRRADGAALIMRADLFVYISGPVTAKHGFSIEENVAAGVKVYLELLGRGIPAFCPHLSGAFPTAWSSLDHAAWLAYDYAVIDRCTHVLMMPRWESSAGAVLERHYADRIGKPVIFSIDEL